MNELIQLNLSSLTGRKYWRSLNQLADTPEFRQWVEREFPDGASELLDSGSRRTLLKLMAAGFGLGGLTACRRPVEKILPLSKGVEGYVHGRPLHYATAVEACGVAAGLVVECNDGRPTKVEGNTRHPFSLGATNAFHQAMILDLYDPDRARQVQKQGVKSSWADFEAWWLEQSAKLGDGSGLRILSPRSTSPALESLKAEIAKKFPQSAWIEYESVNFDRVLEGTRLAFGQPLQPHYRFDQADVVVALDCDFLGLDTLSAQPVKQFSARRRPEEGRELNRLYAVESNFTVTGAMADHRLRARASDVASIALALARELNVTGAELKVLGESGGRQRQFLAAVAKDLLARRGRSLVVAGPRQPAEVHALVAVINQALGNAGQTVSYTRPPYPPADSLAAVQKLSEDLAAGRVSTLFVLGGNPVFTLHATADWAALFRKTTAVVLAADENETWKTAAWQLPEAHPFESWGDVRALDGTVSIRQPQIQPLYGGRSALEVAALIAGRAERRGYDLVRSFWSAQWGADAESKWKKALYEGVIEGTASPRVDVKADAPRVFAAAQSAMKPAPAGIEIVFYPSWHTLDGRFANNAWLQETPDPMTKLVWDNAALLSPATARRLGVKDGDVLEISAGGRRARCPALVLPGHADDSVSLQLGFGRSACGRVGRGVGHRVEALRTASNFWFGSAEVRRTGATYKLVTTQEHHTLIEPITRLKRHNIVEEFTLGEYRQRAEHGRHERHPPTDLFPGFDYSKGYQWGMTIDLSACIGCNACMVACTAENNIPVVGKDQVSKGREMHWIRLDRYFSGEEDDPQAVMQPMACVQCEKAPCESVCPVAATAHSPEGINEMAYNRCVGTRYCLNNCPYKVRRFNFLNWNKDVPEVRKMVFNPDVTVRMRGVMEKCNYCVQRIEEKRSQAKAEGRRPIRDGEIVTACQQACPADAIVFGNINDPESRVSKLKREARDYSVLEELNTKPRTSYLARVRNPNPELV